jgi:hypothetical protein
MISAEFRPIVETLYKKAKANQVNWVVAADLGVGSKQDDFVGSLADYAINVYRNNEGQAALSVLNSRGKGVVHFALDASDADFAMVSEMIDLAARQVGGIDDALTVLKRAMAEEGVIGQRNPPRLVDDDDLPF